MVGEFGAVPLQRQRSSTQCASWLMAHDTTWASSRHTVRCKPPFPLQARTPILPG